ncbi:MAG: transposase [Chloroflexi bacterium]|nr:transposase [Chloroflexota bacterium]
MNQRFRPSGCGSFFGDHYIYGQVVPKTHFLRHLKDLIPWEELTKDLLSCYQGRAQYGPIPYHPALLIKMLVLAFLYKLSERQTEGFVGDSLAARYFVGLGVDQVAPDHSTLSVFRERILAERGPKGFDQLFQEVVRIANEKGIAFGRIQVVDATHSVADVDVKKDDERKEKGQGPRDKDAAWGSKGKKRTKTVDGKTVVVNKSFYGYKSHFSLNAQSGIITSVVATSGERTDGKQLGQLVEKDQEVGVEAEIYAGDKGYDDERTTSYCG